MGYMTEKPEKYWYRTYQTKYWESEFLNLKKEDLRKINWEDEWPKCDHEQSVLVQMIFGELLKKSGLIKEHYIQSYYSKGVLQDDKEMYIYYDVMNTRKPPNIRELKHPLGDWKLYHSLGNFSIYPKMQSRSLQFIHNDCNEDWGEFLKFLNENWDVKIVKRGKYKYVEEKSYMEKWGGISFQQYMKLTCQHMYYKRIYEELKCINENITTTEILKLIQEYNSRDLSQEELLHIDENIDVKFLITIRERFIFASLNSNEEV